MQINTTGNGISFEKWRNNNVYFNKKFSVFGDSISTLKDHNPSGYNIFYNEENCRKSGVLQASDTWWGKVIDFFGGELLVNNSWSGSVVTKIMNANNLFPSGCSDERTSALHKKRVKPDVIIVYLGTNDWARGVSINSINGTHVIDDSMEFFENAYSTMLYKIKENYPKSEIWCCTLCESYMSDKPQFKFPHKFAGRHIEEYNDVIRELTYRRKCKLIDLYKYNTPYEH